MKAEKELIALGSRRVAYRRPEFGLSADIRDCLFCIAQRSSPVVKLFEIVAAIFINMHNNVCAKLAPSLFTDAQKCKPRERESLDFAM